MKELNKNDVFYANKQRIEHAWKLVEIARNLIGDVVDTTDSTLDEAYLIVKQLYRIDEDLYPLYNINAKLFHED